MLTAFLKSALLKSVLLCIEVEEQGEGNSCIVLWEHSLFHLHPLPLLLQPFPPKSCHTKIPPFDTAPHPPPHPRAGELDTKATWT